MPISTKEKKNMIDSSRENVENLFNGLNDLVNQITNEQVREKVEENIDEYLDSDEANRQYNDYVGYTPDVKAYLEGSPLSMFNKEKNQRKKIDIYMNSSYSAKTSHESIFNRGAIVLSLIEILESMGFSVDFHLFEMAKVDSEIHYSDFLFKREGERLNPKKMYFPLYHPSWIRRLDFRLIEVTPDINYEWPRNNYGRPCRLEIIKDIIDLEPRDIIIPTIDELGIQGDNIIDDANSLFNYINNLDNNDFTIGPIEKSKIKKKKYK